MQTHIVQNENQERQKKKKKAEYLGQDFLATTELEQEQLTVSAPVSVSSLALPSCWEQLRALNSISLQLTL